MRKYKIAGDNYSAYGASNISTLIQIPNYLYLNVFLMKRVESEIMIFLLIFFIPIISLLFYFYFNHDDRYEEIIKRFNGINDKERKIMNFKTWTYLIITYLLPFVIGYKWIP